MCVFVCVCVLGITWAYQNYRTACMAIVTIGAIFAMLALGFYLLFLSYLPGSLLAGYVAAALQILSGLSVDLHCLSSAVLTTATCTSRGCRNTENVWDFDSCQWNVRVKMLSGKSGLKLFIVSCIYASIPVFSWRFGLVVTLWLRST